MFRLEFGILFAAAPIRSVAVMPHGLRLGTAHPANLSLPLLFLLASFAKRGTSG
jgi:hypothetical protein